MASFKAAYDGSSYEFVEPAPLFLTCKLCTSLLLQPHVTSCCGKHYCKSCLEKQRHETSVCPNCKAPFRHWYVAPADNKVKGLVVYCTHKMNGCSWTGPLSAVKAHSTSCTFMPTSKLSRSFGKIQSLEEIVSSIQHQSSKPCDTVSSPQLNASNYLDSCLALEPREEIPNTVNEDEIMDNSSMEKVDCMYNIVGCPVRTLRIDQELHLQTHLNQHASMLFRSIHRTTEAVMEESKFMASLPASKLNLCRLSMECMRTITGHNGMELIKNGPLLTMRVSNYSKLKESGQQWRSMEFTVNQCPMRVVIVAGGTGEGRGTHLSVILEAVRLNAERRWMEGIIGVQLQPQVEEMTKLFMGSFWRVNAQKIQWKGVEKKAGLTVRLCTCAMFVTHEDLECGMLLNDSLILQIKKVKD